MSDTISVRATSFEIVPNNDNQSSTEPRRQLSGFVNIEDDAASFEALKELCSKENVDKIIIVYHDYAFRLVGVSFTDDNTNPPSIIGSRYKFSAKDIHLEGLSGF